MSAPREVAMNDRAHRDRRDAQLEHLGPKGTRPEHLEHLAYCSGKRTFFDAGFPRCSRCSCPVCLAAATRSVCHQSGLPRHFATIYFATSSTTRACAISRSPSGRTWRAVNETTANVLPLRLTNSTSYPSSLWHNTTVPTSPRFRPCWARSSVNTTVSSS